MKIVIFGVGKLGKRLLQYRLRPEHEIVMICDNDMSKWSHTVSVKKGEGHNIYTIMPPDRMLDAVYDIVLVSSETPDIVREICCQLLNFGVELKKIYTLINVGIDKYSGYILDSRSVFEIPEKFHHGGYKHIMELLSKRPLDINLELIDYCPLKCCFCFNRKVQRSHCVMEMGLFEKIIREYVAIGGGSLGLSSMQSDVFSDPMLLQRLSLLKKMKSDVFVYTTNPLISLGKYDDREIAKIFQIINYIQVSVEGTNREDYYKMAGIDGFNIFYQNLYHLKHIIKEYRLDVQIELHFRTDDSHKLKEDIIYRQLSEDFVVFGILDTFFDWNKVVKINDLPSKARLERRDNRWMENDCCFSNSTLAIQPDGDVVGCGCMDWSSKFILGNCYHDNLHDIYFKPKAISFRKAFSSRKIPKICQECGFYCSTKSRWGNACFQEYQPRDGLLLTNRIIRSN